MYFIMQGLGTDEDCLIEILCSRSKPELEAIITTYKKSKYITFSHNDMENWGYNVTTSIEFATLYFATIIMNRWYILITICQDLASK